MNNARFATIIHILTLLARDPDQWHSSDWIAASIGINPVMVRKELSLLQEMGWVVGKRGKEGGSMLGASSCNISLADIYKAVRNTDVLGRKNNSTNSRCPVGKKINKALESLFAETDQMVISALQHKSLKNFADQFS